MGKGGTCRMQKGMIYDLVPFVIYKGKRFYRVRCISQTPNRSDEYVVEGIPMGGDRKEMFLLRFKKP